MLDNNDKKAKKEEKRIISKIRIKKKRSLRQSWMTS